jgi:hypothetical protein
VHWRKEEKKPADLLPFKAPDGSLVYDRSRSTEAKLLPKVTGISVIDDLDQLDEQAAAGATKPSQAKSKGKKGSRSQASQGKDHDGLEGAQKGGSRCAFEDSR